MFCKNCGQALNDHQAVCLNCGVEVGNGNSFCHNCGKEVTPEAAFCLNCGVALKEDNKKVSETLGGQNRNLMALLAFLVGGWGVHNFILGEVKKGITRIILTCCCGIGGILALVDFIKILCGTYVIDPEKYFF